MKRLFLAFLLLALPLTPVGWTGMSCKPSQQRVAYNTLYSLALGVNTSYAAYNDQVVAGKANFSQTVAKAYNDFQSALNVSVVAAHGSTTAIASQDLVDLANAVYAAINQFTKK